MCVFLCILAMFTGVNKQKLSSQYFMMLNSAFIHMKRQELTQYNYLLTNTFDFAYIIIFMDVLMPLWTQREHELLLQVSPVVMVLRATRHTLPIIRHHRGGLGDQVNQRDLVIQVNLRHKGHLGDLGDLLGLDNLA